MIRTFEMRVRVTPNAGGVIEILDGNGNVVMMHTETDWKELFPGYKTSCMGESDFVHHKVTQFIQGSIK